MSLFQIAYAKAGTVHISKGTEVIRVSVNSGPKVAEIAQKAEVLGIGWDTLAKSLNDHGIRILSGTDAELVQSFGRTTLFHYMTVECLTDEARKAITRIIAAANDSANVATS